MYTKVIAKKGRSYPKNPALGVIIPIFGFDEATGTYIHATREMYPDDQEIFIYAGYAQIDHDIQENELFEINDIRRVNDPSKSCQYSAAANDYQQLPFTMFIPIIDAKFDVNNKELQAVHFNSFFFIRSGNSIYGPLAADYDNNNKWRPINRGDDRFENVYENLFSHIEDNHDCVLQFKVDTFNEGIIGDYVLDLNMLLQSGKYTTIYAGTKEDTIAWARTKLPNALAASKAESDFLKKLSTFSLPNITLPSEKQKLEAFSRYVGEANDVINVALPNLFERYLESDAGRANLETYLAENASSFIQEYRKDEFTAADRELKSKREEIDALELQAASLKQNLEANNEKILEGVDEGDKAKLRHIIKNEDQRNRFLKLFDATGVYESVQVKVQQLEGKREILEDDVKRRQNEVNKLEAQEKAVKAAIVTVKDKFFKEEDFATRLVETKIYSDILNNIEPVSLHEKNSELQAEYKVLDVHHGNIEAIEFINEITNRLDSLGRTINPNDVVNYLVSLHQNFLTIFAGLPGVGKTSLVTKLSQALGAYAFDRFLAVPVQKGWTSNKDLIGYYNPITRRYQPAKTGMYQLLRLLHKDAENGQEYPAIVLLDEANLSPIEHYWAEFSSIADDENKRPLRISDEHCLKIGKGMRFLATINYDHTTEVLSERLISRAPIIKLSKSDIGLSDDLPAEFQFPIFDYAKLDYWLREQRESYKVDVKTRFESIIKKLEEDNPALGVPIIVSARKQRAVEKYCAAASPLMKMHSPLTALDYAVNQHILPLIAGRGDAYKKRLEALHEKLQSMPISSKHLTNIIQAGDQNFKYYKFFY
ncbi:AAA family ATPase [Chitinophaga sp. S165]|uniref:AAA family ATPase n=1 Tax=Chitinophaga sp. S165 TaxID=2135462 RepID=UPI000D70EF1E|nr:AAA family ATPase [Chitinophaga sp. S165]PWV55529.1 dynein-related subfamily AAA family protein [Chitinophaga sp. S165]